MLLPTRVYNIDGFYNGTQHAPAATSTWGNSLTSGATANTYGSWVSLTGSNLSFATHRIVVRLSRTRNSSGTTSAQSLRAYVDLGLGPNSGAVTPIVDALCGSHSFALGTFYDLPIYANTLSNQLWARCQMNASSALIDIRCELYGHHIDGGTDFVRRIVALGLSSSTTEGTSCTPGLAGVGAWTQIVASTSERYIGLMGSPVSSDDTTMAAGTIFSTDLAIGGAGAEQLIAHNVAHSHTYVNTEMRHAYVNPVLMPVPSGTRLSARLNCSTGPDSVNSVWMWGLLGG